MTVRHPLNAGDSTCPCCGKTWVVTPFADCLLPACGCFGSDASADNLERPCYPCGLRHAWTCPEMPHRGEQREA